jgi:hypothetical protein
MRNTLPPLASNDLFGASISEFHRGPPYEPKTMSTAPHGSPQGYNLTDRARWRKKTLSCRGTQSNPRCEAVAVHNPTARAHESLRPIEEVRWQSLATYPAQVFCRKVGNFQPSIANNIVCEETRRVVCVTIVTEHEFIMFVVVNLLVPLRYVRKERAFESRPAELHRIAILDAASRGHADDKYYGPVNAVH